MTNTTTSPIRLDERSSDLAEARDVLAAAYDGVDWQVAPSGPDFSFRYASSGDETMTLRAIEFGGRITGRMERSDDFVVQWISRGEGSFDDGHDGIRLRPGVPQIWPDGSFGFDFDDYSQRLVQVSRAAVERIAGERGIAAPGLRFDHTARPDDRSLRIWKDTVTLMSRTVLDRHASPLLQAEMGRLGAIALLELYPTMSSALPAELLLPRNAHVLRAVEYVHAHAHLPITSTEIAAVATLSLRALQQAFQRQFGISPNGYLRQVRLDRVRDALLEADPRTASIGDIAKAWGFAHAGRFSGVYFERHGEYPRDTLRRSR